MAAAIVGSLLLAAPASATDPAAALAAFERIVGGEWHLGDGYQVFEWGVGKRSVKGRSYFLVDGEARLVSEGAWFWHPGEEAIRGFFTAIEMPVALFDFTTRFEGETLISELVAYGPDGSAQRFRETWTFTGDDRFDWSLMQVTPEGERQVMAGTYSRE